MAMQYHVTDKKLEELLSGMIDMVISKINKVKSKTPELKMDQSRRSALIKGLAKSLKDNNKNDDLKAELFFNDNFIKHLTLCITTTILTDKLTINDKGETLEKAISAILDGKDLGLEKLSPEKFKKLLNNPTAFEKLLEDKLGKDAPQKLRSLIQQFSENFVKEMQSLGMKPKPDAAKTIEDDVYSNLFGLITSAIPGGLAIPTPVFVGNGHGFNDWSPHNGRANIEKVNEINTQFGDSQGLEAIAMRHFSQIEDSQIHAMPNLLKSVGIEDPKITLRR